MSATSDLIKPILASPNFRQLLDEMEAVWAEEQRRRLEFYDRITPEHKWEFINGEIVVHSPAKNMHLEAVERLFLLIKTFVSIHDLGVAHSEKALIPASRNDYEPDIAFFTTAQAAEFTPDTWKFPPPTLVVEVLSKDFIKRDRETKFKDYALLGIPEYWIIDPETETVEQYRLPEGAEEYVLHTKKERRDQVSSLVLPDFTIPVAAIFDGAANLAALRAMLA